MEDVLPSSTDPGSMDSDANRIRRRFGGAFKPRPWIYWLDMSASAAVGWTCFAWALQHPLGSPAHLLLTAASIFALLRGALFIHELAHLKRAALPGFEIAWHAVVGLPLMLPSLMYVGSHNDHHRRAYFGTLDDPEYAPIARWSRLRILGFVMGVALVPLVLPVRWGLGPLSYRIPRLRRLAVERASTLAINPSYRRPMPSGAQVGRWATQEAAASAFFWIVPPGLPNDAVLRLLPAQNRQ